MALEPPDIDLDEELEERCAKQMEALLASKGWGEPERNAQVYFTFGGPHARLQYFRPRVPRVALSRLLVSGAGAGSEMLAARAWGFEEVVGTEVEEDFVDIVRTRLAEREGFDIVRTVNKSPDPPLVVMMSFHESELVQTAASSRGADGCISKADIPEHLVSQVEALIERRGIRLHDDSSPREPAPEHSLNPNTRRIEK